MTYTLDFETSSDQSDTDLVAALAAMPKKAKAELASAYTSKFGSPIGCKRKARWGGWEGRMLESSLWCFSWEKSEPNKDLHLCYYLRGREGFVISDECAEVLSFGLKRPPFCKDWVIEKRDGQNILCAYVMDGVIVLGDGGMVYGVGGKSTN